MLRGRTIRIMALAVVVLAASGSGRNMGEFRPRVKLARHYTITNAAELAPVTILASQFLNSECSNSNTRKAYETALSYFSEYCSKQCGRRVSTLQYSDLSRALVVNFRDARLELESPASAELRLRVVKAFCSWCSDRFQVPHPALGVPSRFQPNEEFKGLNKSDRERLINVCKSRSNPMERFVPLLLLYTGIRNDEAVNLTIGQIDENKEWINRVIGKSTNIRDVMITDELRHELTRFLWWRAEYPMRASYPLLPSTYNTVARGVDARIDNKTVWRIVNSACRDARTETDVRKPHALRHTFAYSTLEHLEDQGIKPGRALIILKDLMGHKDIKTTMRYLGNDKAEHYELLREMR